MIFNSHKKPLNERKETMEQNINIQNICDVREYFNTITQMTAIKYIILETNEVFFELESHPDQKKALIPQKDFVTSKLRNILDQCQMYLKPSIASKSRSQQIATLYQMLSDYAHHHPVFVSKNPGFFMILIPKNFYLPHLKILPSFKKQS